LANKRFRYISFTRRSYGRSANSIGTQTVAAPDADDYTAFEDLTQEIVEAWLEASDLDVEAIKEGLDTQIVEKITPTSVTKQLPTA
jgi:hypothetical protein